MSYVTLVFNFFELNTKFLLCGSIGPLLSLERVLLWTKFFTASVKLLLVLDELFLIWDEGRLCHPQVRQDEVAVEESFFKVWFDLRNWGIHY